MSKFGGGFTLIETVIALALWLILSAGIFLVWQHSALSATGMMERQRAFENARGSMDLLKMNIQMARCIGITKNGDVMNVLTLNQRRREGNTLDWHNFQYRFSGSASQLQIGRLGADGLAGTWREVAADIYSIRLVYNDDRIRITITTTCEDPQILESSVCVRNKCLTIRGARINAATQQCPQGTH
ncbi:MAG: hypothetical protein FWB80_04430 [Defluviitaleaceae bacterium]|nr:hypothetical protein [Defluviitaleaceae bacterium]